MRTKVLLKRVALLETAWNIVSSVAVLIIIFQALK